MNTYTYTIFDGNPAVSGPCAWPSHDAIEVRATNPGNVLQRALRVARVEGGTSRAYHRGDRLWVEVWDEDGTIVASGSTVLTRGQFLPHEVC